MGATFAFTEAAVANYREKDDAINGASGACAAGFLAGIRGAYSVRVQQRNLSQIMSSARSLPMAVASCAVMGAAMGTFDYGGKSLQGTPETQEERRKRFFKQPPPTFPAHSSGLE